MNYRIVLAIGLVAASASGACLENVDSGATGGSGSTSSGQDDAGAGLPSPFTDADLSQQCEAGSALCFELCGAPSCAQQDNTIPSELTTPAIILPDGGTTTDACVQLSALSHGIRQRSCAMCHGPPPAPGFSGFNFVLDDNALVTQVPQTVSLPLIIPGDPAASVFIQRIALSLAGGQTGMPPSPSVAANLAGSNVANSIAYPTAEEVSVLSAWIASCVPGADGGAYGSGYYGGDYGPDAARDAPPGSDASPGVDASGADAGTGVDASQDVDSGRIRDGGGGRG